MASLNELKQRLDKTIEIEDTLDRRLWVLAVVTEALSAKNVRPILVGGCAVEFYTAGGYATKDVDVVIDPDSDIAPELLALGFEREGRFWRREDIDLVMEMPTGPLAGDLERLVKLEIDGLPVYVISVEDLIIDRLNAFVHWKSTEDRRWVLHLLWAMEGDIDWNYLDSMAAKDRLGEALSELRLEIGGG